MTNSPRRRWIKATYITDKITAPAPIWFDPATIQTILLETCLDGCRKTHIKLSGLENAFAVMEPPEYFLGAEGPRP